MKRRDEDREQRASTAVGARMQDGSPWVAEAVCVEPMEAPLPPPQPRRAQARRALACAILGVLFFGLVFGPLAVALGHRVRLAMLAESDTEGAPTARAAIALGRLGLAIHLTIAMAVLPWLLFLLPLLNAG